MAVIGSTPRPSFGTRSLLAGVASLAVVSALVANWHHGYTATRDSLTELRKLSRGSGSYFATREDLGRSGTLLQACLSPGRRFEVLQADLSSSGIGLKRQLDLLKYSPDLEELALGYTGANYKDVAIAVRQFPSLRHLDLSYSEITDEDLRLVAELSDLEELSLNGTNITGTGLVYLTTGCERLANLELEGCPLSPKCLEHLLRFRVIERIDVSRTGVHSNRLVPLLSLKSLKELRVVGIHLDNDFVRRSQTRSGDLWIAHF